MEARETGTAALPANLEDRSGSALASMRTTRLDAEPQWPRVSHARSSVEVFGCERERRVVGASDLLAGEDRELQPISAVGQRLHGSTKRPQFLRPR